jgi:DNA replication and checkpoint protein
MHPNEVKKNIKVWEAGFKLEHGRKPEQTDIKARPRICMSANVCQFEQ